MFVSNRDMANWVLPYLPSGAELLYKDNQAVLQWADLDHDGINEVFGLYRYNHQSYLFVLKNSYGSSLFYFPVSHDVQKKAFRTLTGTWDERTVYLFPAAMKEIGGTKWGYIDEKGKFILPSIYEHAADFQDNDLAIVGLKDHTGVINADGYLIVEPKYNTINSFSEGRAIVNDAQGFKVIDESGKEITAKAYSYIGDFKEGRALIADTEVNSQYLYGYLNKRGKEVIPLSYEIASDFNQGKAVVKSKYGQYTLIDLTGKVLKSFPYPFVGNYGEGLLAFQKSKDGKFGYIDEQGNMVIEPQFSGAQSFIDGRAIINLSEDDKDHFGLIDRKGQFVIKANYNNLLYLGESRFALGKETDLKLPCSKSIYALADSEGHILTGFIFNEINNFQDGCASVSNNTDTFFIDKNGRRMEHLPMIDGSGTLCFLQTLIKGDIDNRLLYFNRNPELVWKQNTIIPLNSRSSVSEHKYKPNKDYLVYFPQVQGMEKQESVNRALEKLSGVKVVPAHEQLESNYMGDFEVSFYKKELLVIEITGYDYPFCAAHGMPVKKYAHINLKTGSMYQLSDLFKPQSPYVKVISGRIGEQIKSNDKFSYIFPNEYKGIKADQPFFISEAGLNIYFTPNEIAAFAAGFPTFTIPFGDLKDMINQDGKFWESFH
ncbi:WG repeat-containing protein [Neobacillus soli]|uniref:WG repeat-containing protein n=1 Tax=Neobacillus soli TaxID=220688 RepID=UPI000B0FCF7A|nr:WG repeat-containing protein [Neobacillus soli]